MKTEMEGTRFMPDSQQPPAYDRPPTEILLPAVRDGILDRSSQGIEKEPSYYGLPIIKQPTWKWYIPTYFFLGGVASGSSLIGALAEFFGGEEHRSTVRNARYLSLGLAALCPIPLIVDLGRPERFHHMLRVVKVSSPLNLGTWILSGFGLLSGVLAAHQAAQDSFIVPRQSWVGRLLLSIPTGPFTFLHGIFGMALGGYTGTLLAVTTVPLWASAGVLLGPLFLSASATSGAAALVLMGLLTGDQGRRARQQIQVVANIASAMQFGLAAAHDTFMPERISKPLHTGRWGLLFRGGAVGGGLFLPAALRFAAWIANDRLERILSALAGSFTLLGTLSERIAIVEAGKVSARDPYAYLDFTRGMPGQARPSPEEQARQAPRVPRFAPGVSVSDYIGFTGQSRN